MGVSSYIFDIGIVIYLYQKNQSLQEVGGFFIAQLLPAILVLFSGEIIDYFQSKNVLIISNLCKILIFISIIFVKNIWFIYCVTFIYNLLLEFERNMTQVLVSYLCKKEDIFRVNSVLNVVDGAIMVIIPIIVAIMTEKTSLNLLIIIASLALSLTILGISFISRKKTILSTNSRKIMCGRVYLDLFKNKKIRNLSLLWMVFMICIGITGPLEIVMIETILNKSSFFYGVGNTIEGIGLLFASIIVTFIARKYYYYSIIPIGMACAACSYLIIGLSPTISFYLIGAFFVGITSTLCPMGFRNELQMICEENMIGRCLASVRFFVISARLAGTLITSTFVHEKYIRMVYILVTFILIISFFYIYLNKDYYLEPNKQKPAN